MTTTQWGRKETIVRPPHAPVYSFGAGFGALLLTCVFMGLYIGFLMPPLQRWYLPVYLRTGVIGMVRKADTYQLLNVADAHLHARPTMAMDVESGSTLQPNGRPLPLALSEAARRAGLIYLYPGSKILYRNGPLHAYLQRFFTMATASVVHCVGLCSVGSLRSLECFPLRHGRTFNVSKS